MTVSDVFVVAAADVVTSSTVHCFHSHSNFAPVVCSCDVVVAVAAVYLSLFTVSSSNCHRTRMKRILEEILEKGVDEKEFYIFWVLFFGLPLKTRETETDVNSPFIFGSLFALAHTHTPVLVQRYISTDQLFCVGAQISPATFPFSLPSKHTPHVPYLIKRRRQQKPSSKRGRRKARS